ncbi:MULTISPECIES: DUF305 domain-containing protein [unclassified Cyanobium]|uniref:DUF305 domain-containing protein n=1 Tax=unclassified Cyanobium TaxID=2627006 RepID=UPI0020CB98D6|nr:MULTISPECIES: DUF305 domain-containing protein [unclassified Cyanobium]MCP9858954.1 DUF305 domain-containing protein [Cyanobium sp. Cruz-8H5]MCP9866190.1 DUF305 domain-containing protein [Cyanobium sp. Cruz-8D1]
MRPSRISTALLGVLGALTLAAPALAQNHGGMEHNHHNHATPSQPNAAGASAHAEHAHDVGPAGATYDLRFIDGMVQHHTGALRMSEFVFGIGAPGVGALATTIWRDQANEIRAMGLWRKAWYPQAPVYPVALAKGGDPNSLAGLSRMGQAQIDGMRMMGDAPTKENRVTWFLEGMLHHHGGALTMAHDALAKSTNPTIRRFARQVIVAQRAEIIELRRMLAVDGLRKPVYARYDSLFAL